MSTPGPLIRRVEQLEAAVQRQQQAMGGLLGRSAQGTGTRWTYLARTIATSGSYPLPSSGANTFGLQFIDREYSPSEGAQSATDHTRSATYQAIGRTLDGRYVPEGQVVLAMPAPRAAGTTGKGRWNILADTVKIYLGQADGPIPSGSSGTAKRFSGGDEADQGISDNVINKWPTIADGDWLIYGEVQGDGTLYVLAPSGGSSGGGGSSSSGIPFYNNSGETIPPYAAMWAVDTLLVGSVNYVEAIKVSTAFDHSWLVNGATAIAPLGTGLGHWLCEATGPVAVGSEALSVASGHELGPQPFSWLLAPYRVGFLTLGSVYTAGGVSVVDCKQRHVDRVLGKFYADMPQGGSAPFEIWYRGADHKIRPSGWDKITVYDFWLNKGETVKAGVKGAADWMSDHWEGDAACDVDNTDSSQQSPGSQTPDFSGGNTPGDAAFAFSGGTGTGTGI